MLAYLFERVACGAESELEGFAWDAFDVGSNGPREAVGDGACEGDGLDLQVEAAVALFVAPVGVEAPEEAVLFGGREGVLGGGAWVVDLGDAVASGDAVAVLDVEMAEGDVVGGVHDDGDDMMLADAHRRLHVVCALCEDASLKYLWSKVLGVGVEVAHEAFEVGGCGAVGEGGAAPVVEKRAGEVGVGGGRDLLEDEVTVVEACVQCIGVGRGRKEGVGGPVLPRESPFDTPCVGVEGGDGGGCGLSHERAWSVEQEQQAAQQGHLARGCEEAVLHVLHRALSKLEKQCMEAHAGTIVPHGACSWECVG